MEIVREHSETALKLAAEENMRFYLKTCPLPDDEVLDEREMFRWCSGISYPLLNWVLGVKLTPENARKKVEDTITYFKGKKVPFLWWNGPSTQPPNLGKIMQSAGMIKIEPHSNMGDMFMDIRNLNALESTYKNILEKSGIKIKYITTAEDLHEAVGIIAKTMNLPNKLLKVGDVLCKLLLEEEPGVNNAVGYLAYTDGKPFSVSTVYYGGGVAGIYSVGTLKEYQKRGIGTAITLAPLIDARKRGYEIAVLTATEQGFPVYKKIGFNKHEVWDQYMWLPFFKKLLVRIVLFFQRKRNHSLKSH